MTEDEIVEAMARAYYKTYADGGAVSIAAMRAALRIAKQAAKEAKVARHSYAYGTEAKIIPALPKETSDDN